MQSLAFDERVYREMVALCVAARPYEACGFLGGRRGAAYSHYPVKNVAEDRARQYFMDPVGQLKALQQMEARGEELVAIYHSHPASSPVPSSTDIEQAYYPDAFYVIVGASTDPPTTRVYRLNACVKSAVEVRWRTYRHRHAGPHRASF